MNNSSSIPRRGLRVLQLNGQKSKSVAAEIPNIMAERDIQVLLLQEPYAPRNQIQGLPAPLRVVSAAPHGETPYAAIVIADPRIDVTLLGGLSSAHVVCAELVGQFGAAYVVSCYCQPSNPITDYLGRLDEVAGRLRGKPLLIGMDANAKSFWWNSRVTDGRGRQLEDFILQHDLQVLNTPTELSTYCSVHGESWIDVTLATRSASNLVSGWDVKEWATSDHRAIHFVYGATGVELTRPVRRMARYNCRKADWERFDETLALALPDTLGEDCEAMVGALTDAVLFASDASIPLRGVRRLSVPWWTPELASQRRSVRAFRRALQKARRIGNVAQAQEAKARLSRVQNRYKRSVMEAKEETWRRLAEESRDDPWGFLYRCALKKGSTGAIYHAFQADGGETTGWEDSMRAMLGTLIRRDDPGSDTPNEAYEGAGTDEGLSEGEIGAAVLSMGNKAPGPDRVEVAAVKRAWEILPDVITTIMQRCILEGEFPTAWKRGRLCMIKKSAAKPDNEVASYRPICLLPVMGKVFEKVLANRVKYLYREQGLEAPNQYGFKRGAGTSDALTKFAEYCRIDGKYIAAVFEDFAAAFDTLWWPSVFRRLRTMGCPIGLYRALRGYLNGRSVEVQTEFQTALEEVNRGCPQGSVLGPLFWNIVLDEYLTQPAAHGEHRVAYADDVVLIFSAESGAALQRSISGAVDELEAWASRNRLCLSPDKTVGMLLRGKMHRASLPRITICGGRMRWVSETRYLGVLLDRRMQFIEHARWVRQRVQKLAGALLKVGRNDWGLSKRSLRTVYPALCLSVVTYGAPLWWHRRDVVHVRRHIDAAQRPFLLLLTEGWRTTSTGALQVLAGVLPLDLAILKAAAAWHVRKGREFRDGDFRVAPPPDTRRGFGRLAKAPCGNPDAEST